VDRVEQGRGGGEAAVARKGGQQAVLVLACCVRSRFGAAAHAHRSTGLDHCNRGLALAKSDEALYAQGSSFRKTMLSCSHALLCRRDSTLHWRKQKSVQPARYSLTTIVESGEQLLRKSAWAEMKDLVREAKAVVKISSFQIIVAQGVTGSFPWSVLAFAPMWLELMGFTHNRTGLLMITFALASSLGGLLGGNMGDHFATCFPNFGQIVLS
jgi:hypothetical protein